MDPLFTCLSCSIAFLSADEQRVHYQSDHHRYNMKRRVASLPPVTVATFNQKVMERRQETALKPSAKGTSCDVCRKAYTTENAFRSHMLSKKHRDNEMRSTLKHIVVPSAEVAEPAPPAKPAALEDPSEDEITQTIDEKIAAARSRLSPNKCLFCPHASSSLDDNLTHMSSAHSFFIPDAEYLVDLTGLISYLGEKIAVGNVCIYCNDKGREFRTLDAVRKHMLDKSHCKMAYSSEDEKLEISDFYDFSSSYPDKAKKDNGEWEDLDDDEAEVDEVVSEDNTEEEDLPDNQITYGDSNYELVLPSGARIGHRSMRRYYAQSFPGAKNEDPNSGAALVQRLLADRNSALVPRKGGFGAFGKGTEVVKARNRGEAREAGRHVREFRDIKRREDFKTRVAFIHNSQKHFRDPLLQ